MKTLLFDQQNQLRNGWWIVIFIALIAITRLIYPTISHQLQDLGASKALLGPLAPAFVILVTWICLKFRNQTLADVGLHINRPWLTQFHLGLLLSALQIAIAVLGMWLFNGIVLTVNPEFEFNGLLLGLYVFLFAALLEELLFRGFIFQRLIDGIGFWPAQLLCASLFAFGHLSNPEINQDTMIVAALDLALGAILWGLAYYKTKSLALPIGLHLGWNFTQGDIFGFAVSGYEKQGLLQPSLLDNHPWITGAGFGVEASIFAVMVDLILIMIIAKWPMRNQQQTIPSNKKPNIKFTASLNNKLVAISFKVEASHYAGFFIVYFQ